MGVLLTTTTDVVGQFSSTYYTKQHVTQKVKNQHALYQIIALMRYIPLQTGNVYQG